MIESLIQAGKKPPAPTTGVSLRNLERRSVRFVSIANSGKGIGLMEFKVYGPQDLTIA